MRADDQEINHSITLAKAAMLSAVLFVLMVIAEVIVGAIAGPIKSPWDKYIGMLTLSVPVFGVLTSVISVTMHRNRLVGIGSKLSVGWNCAINWPINGESWQPRP